MTPIETAIDKLEALGRHGVDNNDTLASIVLDIVGHLKEHAARQAEVSLTLLETIQFFAPLIDECESGDVELSGTDIAATLRHFILTGEPRLLQFRVRDEPWVDEERRKFEWIWNAPKRDSTVTLTGNTSRVVAGALVNKGLRCGRFIGSPDGGVRCAYCGQAFEDHPQP